MHSNSVGEMWDSLADQYGLGGMTGRCLACGDTLPMDTNYWYTREVTARARNAPFTGQRLTSAKICFARRGEICAGGVDQGIYVGCPLGGMIPGHVGAGFGYALFSNACHPDLVR